MAKKVETSQWDASDLLNSPEIVAAYLSAAVEEAEGDPEFLLVALNTIARSGNFSELARELGVSRKGLYKALSADGNPSFALVWELLDKLGVRVEFHAAS